MLLATIIPASIYGLLLVISSFKKKTKLVPKSSKVPTTIPKAATPTSKAPTPPSSNAITKIHPVTEGKCRTILEGIYGKPFPPNEAFVRNPRTRRWITLDGYNKELKIAFEYQGEQHYCYPNHFHHKPEHVSKFKMGIARDIFKKKACEAAGIKLLIIPYTKKAYLERYIKSIL